MIALAIMVMVCAILGTFAMGMMFDPSVINASPEILILMYQMVLTGHSKNYGSILSYGRCITNYLRIM